MNGVSGLLAHAGGWDEILVPVVLVTLVFYFGTRRPPEVEPGAPCAYCGASPRGDEPRCETCGFKLPR